MDQNAFRNLLATQSVKPGTGRSAGVLGTHAAKRGAGKSKSSGGYILNKNQAEGTSKKTGKDGEDGGSSIAFAPRKAAGKKGGKDREDGKQNKPYQDRAELRRTGKDDETNEFKAAEKLAEDFERRAREEGQDEEKIEEQRKYLGGDATHSILVKGLDLALLAARKAEIEATEGKKAEDELDAFIEGEHSSSTGPSKEGASTAEGTSGVGRKRTREEIVQQLKRQRTGGNADSGEVAAAPALGSKFKSIAQKKREAEEAQAQTQGKKKLKKKKKVIPPTAAINKPLEEQQKELTKQVPSDSGGTNPEKDQESAIPSQFSNGTRTTSNDPTPTATTPDVPPVTEKVKVSTNAPISGVTPIPDEDDDDIFGGVGEYVGAVGSDSDSGSEDEIERKPSPRSGTKQNERRRSRSRSRSRSASYHNDDRRYSGRREGRYRDDRRSRSRSREDQFSGRDRYGNYSHQERSERRPRSPGCDRDRRYGGEERRGIERYRDHDPRERYAQDDRDYRRRDRSRSLQRYSRSGGDDSYRNDRYRRQYSRSRSPYRQERRGPARSPSPRRSYSPPRRSVSRSPVSKDANPPHRPERSPSRSRSPSPVNIDALRALSQSPGLSDGEDDPYSGPVRPGQSLRALGFASSDVPSARELLEMDALANQADQKRANKAKWRKAQGLAPQEGAGGGDDDDDGGDRNKLGQELTDQQKMRRDQQRLQAYMEKKEKAGK